MSNQKNTMDDLLKIVQILRSPEGCPWDRVQSHESIRFNFIEEAYEVVDAIDLKNTEALEEELGDVLLQIAFHSVLANEENQFSFDDVVDRICKKLIFRHPHIFANKEASSSEEALDQWEEAKKKEKNQNTIQATLEAVPLAFPALMRAEKVQKRSEKGGFPIENLESSILKLEECCNTLSENIGKVSTDFSPILGEMLFLCCNITRFFHVNSEKCLTDYTDSFIEKVSNWENQ